VGCVEGGGGAVLMLRLQHSGRSDHNVRTVGNAADSLPSLHPLPPPPSPPLPLPLPSPSATPLSLLVPLSALVPLLPPAGRGPGGSGLQASPPLPPALSPRGLGTASSTGLPPSERSASSSTCLAPRPAAAAVASAASWAPLPLPPPPPPPPAPASDGGSLRRMFWKGIGGGVAWRKWRGGRGRGGGGIASACLALRGAWGVPEGHCVGEG
jgi:hypothetical protein